MEEIVNLVVTRQWEKAISLAETKEYTKLKFQDKIYKLNETVLINPDPHQPLIVEKVGKLIKIISIIADNIEVPIVKIQLYCDKREIPMNYADYIGCMSSNELFLTEVEILLEYFFIDVIQGHCSVYDFNEYETNLDTKEERVFFTRSEFNIKNQKLAPHPNEWQKICICNIPTNPELAYIQCDKCNKWLHLDCVGLTSQEAEKVNLYECPKCKKK